MNINRIPNSNWYRLSMLSQEIYVRNLIFATTYLFSIYIAFLQSNFKQTESLHL